MFHVKNAVLLVLGAVVSCLSYAQGSYSYKPGAFDVVLKEDTTLQRVIKATPVYSTLSPFEKELLYALNYVRAYPKQFEEEALEPYLKLYPQLKRKYGESLQKELIVAVKLKPIEAEGRLVKLARAHAKDLADNNLMSHSSSDGTSFQQRFEKEGITCGSECINGGQPVSALEALLSLLIDFNVTNLGHRRSLLNPAMSYVGMGTDFGSDNKKVRYTVLDLGCF